MHDTRQPTKQTFVLCNTLKMNQSNAPYVDGFKSHITIQTSRGYIIQPLCAPKAFLVHNVSTEPISHIVALTFTNKKVDNRVVSICNSQTNHSSSIYITIYNMRSDDSGSSPQRHVYDVDDSEYDDSDDDDDDDESSVSSDISNPVMDSSSESSKVNKGGNTTEEIGEHEQMKQYSAVETARVNRWRILVIISILVAGAAVSTITFLTLSNGQTSDAFDAVCY